MENEEQNQHVEDENQTQEASEEPVQNDEETAEESQTNEEETANEVEEVAEDDNGLPFPRARVVNIMKTQITDKQLRSEVKEATNLWLGNMLKKISREMGDTMYGSVGIADFQRATKPYDMIEDIIHEEERLLASIEKLKLDCESISRELKRFFVTLRGKKGDNSI